VIEDGPSALLFRAFCDALGLPILHLTNGKPLNETTAEERAAFLAARVPWISKELIATPAARARLATWVEAGSPAADPLDVHVVADEYLEPLIGSVLAALPPPVLFHMVRHASVLAVGRDAKGWWAWPPSPRSDSTEGRSVLVAGWIAGDDADTDFRSVVKHEVSHCWLEPGPPLVRAPVSVEAIRERREDRALLVKCGAEWNLLHRVVEPEAQREERACALAARWGATGAAASGCSQRAYTRQRIEAEARAAQKS
jgi:hypothetical protein